MSRRQHVGIAVLLERPVGARHPRDRTRRRSPAAPRRGGCGRSARRAARQAPRSLNTRTTSPSAMPRAAASSGCMRDRLAALHLGRPADAGRGRAGCAACRAAGSTSGAAGSARASSSPAIRPAPARPRGPGSRRSRTPRSSRRRSRSCRTASRADGRRDRRGSRASITVAVSAAWHLDDAGLPELVERRQRHAAPGRRSARTARRDAASHRHRVAALGERSPGAEPPRDRRRRCRSRRAPRRSARSALLHGDAGSGSRAGAADVVALERGRRGQHDVGHAARPASRTARGRRSSRAAARRARRRLRSWWWWNGLPPAQ